MLLKTSESEEIIEGYKKALSYIESFSNTSVAKGDKGLSDVFVKRTRALLKAVGNPQNHLKFIHVTGTAGKGTTSALIHDMLVRDGKKAGLFTSPYVSAAIETIKSGELYIAPADFARLAERLAPAIEKVGPYGKPTASELFLVIALLYFKEERCEWAVIEAGIGGRYDATNAIESPKAAVITNIDLDHTKILGKTLEEIAFDKAGIIKKGSSFYTAERRPKLVALFKRICEQKGARFRQTKIEGSSQETNKALAGAVARSLGVSKRAIEASSARLPCRFETVSLSPRIILDGAHDRIKMKAALEGLRTLSHKKLHLVFGMGSISPDSKKMLPVIVPRADSIVVAGSGDMKRKLAHPEAVSKLVRTYAKKGARVSACDDPCAAFDRAIEGAGKDDCILVTGSFFLAGELRKRWFSEEWVLEHRRSFK